jgi:23S rRNA U2552 (ribose-2'-O)-methylase RlmE/FtsJ
MYQNEIFKLSKTGLKLSKSDVIKSDYQNLPEIQLGFFSFIHRNKDKMSILKDIREKRGEFYYVVNPYEHVIVNSKDCLKEICKTFFDKPRILSRAFYKLWEIIVVFDLIDLDKKDFICVALAEGPGSFLQAVYYYRNKYGSSKKDKYFGITINDDNSAEIKKDLIKSFNKDTNGLFIHSTVNTKEAEKNNKDDGDLTKTKTHNNFEKFVLNKGNYADLITADGGFDWKNENYQEQEAYFLILGQILGAIRLNKKGGHFVLKIFETYTTLTLKIIGILEKVYDKVYLFKPKTSRPSNSEKYVVCLNYQLTKNSSEEKTLIKLLESILDNNDNKQFINDFFLDTNLDKNYLDLIIDANKKLTNHQLIQINKLIDYINQQNYFGVTFHQYQKEQLEATKKWVEMFFVDDLKKLKDNQKILQKEL